MIEFVLQVGLLVSGALGFLLGARPDLLFGGSKLGSGTNPAERARAAMELLYPLAAAFFAGFVFSTLVPEALAHSRGTLAAFVAGLAAMGILSRYVFKRDPCCEVGHDHRGMGVVALAAMAVCSINDGILIGLLKPSWFSGLNLGMFLHKVTSSFAIAQLLISSQYRGRSLLAFGAAYVLVSPLAMTAVGFLGPLEVPGVDLMLGFSAGVLAYVTLSSLVPQARDILRRRPRAAFGFAAALALSLGLGFWHRMLHHHGDDGHPSIPIPASTVSGNLDGESVGASE